MSKSKSGIEFIVGIPSYLEADTISFVTKQVDVGLTRHFGQLKSMIVNVDNSSEDDTKGAFLATETRTPKHYISTPKGIKGKGNNFLNLLNFAKKQGQSLKAVLTVDADLRSITPEWIKYLGEPILKGYDYVLPLYSRHQFDGTITNHICYPLVYALLGKDFRQPIGGEIGFSPALMNYWLKQKWNSSIKQYGIDIFMTLQAIFGDFKICESGLGTKVHKASAPKLGPMFTQVITTLFDLLISRESTWMSIPVIKPEPKVRFGLKELGQPQELKINIRELKEKLRAEYWPRERLLKKYLNEYAIMNLEGMFEQDVYNIDTLMWIQVVYQLIFWYRNGSSKVRKDIVEALKPLYFARSVTFNYQTWRYSTKYVEQAILEQAKAFASQKPYFFGLYVNEVRLYVDEIKKRIDK
ncbi:MAG: glycosyl transferase [Candidatus Aminicenantes bacterium]|nr:glycosyl transferase [Candidatus Aminicenantes bacterium]